METIQLARGVYVLPGAVNMGLVQTGAGLVTVDTGLDKQAAKRLNKAANELGEPIVAIVNTHAHADHFGGNADLIKRCPGIEVFAPVAEAPVIRQPILEPQYLWHGALPFRALQNKFLLAPASPVHHEFDTSDVVEIGQVGFQSIFLPGHAHGQCGILVGEVLFAADAYFGREVTDKHGLPFLVDYEKTLASATHVSEVSAEWYVPGHGNATQAPQPDIDYLRARHERAFATLHQLLTEASSLDVLTGRMCDAFMLQPANPGAWALIRTTVAAYLSSGIDAATVQVDVCQGQLVFHAVGQV